MKLNFRIIAKFGLLLVIIGFCMPIACDQNGFEIAEYMTDSDYGFEGFLLYLMFLSAVIGVIIGVLLLMNKNVNPIIDWIIIAVCIASGLYVFITQFKDGPELDNGAYFILIGWIAALIAQIISGITISSTTYTPNPKKDGYAISSLILGILGIPLCSIPILSITGLIMGVIGRKSTKIKSAIAGLILSIIGLIMGIFAITMFIKSMFSPIISY